MDRLYEAVKKAVEKAFEEVGLETFKKTSLFMSNDKVVNGKSSGL